MGPPSPAEKAPPAAGAALILAGVLTLRGNYFAKYGVIRSGLYAPFV